LRSIQDRTETMIDANPLILLIAVVLFGIPATVVILVILECRPYHPRQKWPNQDVETPPLSQHMKRKKK